MKHILLIFLCSICFLLVTTDAKAQKNTTPEPAIASDKTPLKPGENNTASAQTKEPAKPVVLPIKKSETTQQDAATNMPKTNTSVTKTFKEKKAVQPTQEPANMDRPKTSTIQAPEKTDPAKPTPKTAPVKN